MIQNERQYRISKTAAEKFRAALLAHVEHNADIHPLLVRAEKDALESQLNSLLDEINEYEFLKEGNASVLTMDSLQQLPEGLIKARIALGLTQRDLAERLNLKEQQIQKYESEHYRTASLERLTDVANALGVSVHEQIFLKKPKNVLTKLLNKLSELGLQSAFMEERLINPRLEAQLTEKTDTDSERYLLDEIVQVLNRVFGWDLNDLLSGKELRVPHLAAATARYKLPSKRDSEEVAIYSSYAFYLATLVARTQPETIRAEDRRKHLLSAIKSKDYSLETFLNAIWDCGVAVLPLRDSGTFHGACWRIDGKDVIVMKQITGSESRWIFDLLHEFFHATENESATQLEVLELPPDSKERRESLEEKNANKFAMEILLGKMGESIMDECLTSALGQIPRLKSVVENVAERHGLEVGALANCLAYRLASEDINWWGAAQNLDRSEKDPWSSARDVFLTRFNFSSVDEVEERLLQQALG